MELARPDLDLARISRIATSAVAVFLAFRGTDGIFQGLGVAVVLAIVLDIPWWLHTRSAAQPD